MGVPHPGLSVLLAACVMWEGADGQAELDARCCPRLHFPAFFGDIPKNDFEECLPSKLGKFKNGKF